jgi:hypothetical protein
MLATEFEHHGAVILPYSGGTDLCITDVVSAA